MAYRIFPAKFPRGFFEGIHEALPGVRAVIARDDDEILGDDRVTMEFRWAAILARIVGPDRDTGFFAKGAEKAVARTDENEISRNCGRGEDSSAGSKLPNDS